MRNWITIGQLAKQSGLSTRALRHYEELGLLKAAGRTETGYRYYFAAAIQTLERIKSFRTLGFGLAEIKVLMNVDQHLDRTRLTEFLKERLAKARQEKIRLNIQCQKIESILTQLNSEPSALKPSERRFIMRQLDRLTILVTGVQDVHATAEKIRDRLRHLGHSLPIFDWHPDLALPEQGPYLLTLSEAQLETLPEGKIRPDVIVIRNLSSSSAKVRDNYLRLYSGVGPHMTTIFNADDRVSIDLAAQSKIRQGRIFYFSKNMNLEDQIQKIGGVVSDGETVKIYGLPIQPLPLELELGRPLTFNEESAEIAALTAIMDIGLDPTPLWSQAL